MSAITYNTSKLVWIIARKAHAEHADALAEAKRRCSKPGLKAKNVAALEAAILAHDTGAPVPTRKRTLARHTPTQVRTVEIPAKTVELATWEKLGLTSAQMDVILSAC